MSLCKGNCSKEAKFKGWCRPVPIHCPTFRVVFNDKRIRNISKTKMLQAKLGLNPMQNPDICKKNHSLERNRKAAESLKRLGKLGLLPQQTESKELREKRRKNVSRVLRRLYLEGNHPRQRETIEEMQRRFEKISKTLRKLGKAGKLPMQNMTEKEKIRLGKKISKGLRIAIEEGRLKLSDYGQKIPYYSEINVKTVNLRSKWEKATAEFLDKIGLKWSYEPFSIKYWDSQRKIYAFTFPDFYIPELNMIIEVKGNGEFKSRKTIDKVNGIKSSGFKILLFGRKEIKQIRENQEDVTKLLAGVNYEKN